MDFGSLMNGWGWVFFSLLCAGFSAGFYLVNQYFRQPGHLLVFWLRVLVVLAMTPMMPHLVWPKAPEFYIAVFLTVLVGTFADIRTFNVSARYGGGVVSRVQPMTVWGSFFLWFFFRPSLLLDYAAHPWNTVGILLSLAGCVFFAMRLNRCHITRQALLEMLPALLGYTLVTVLNKYAMNKGPLEGAVFGYMYVQSVVAVIAVGGYVFWRESRPQVAPAEKSWAGKTMLSATLMAGAFWICLMITKNYAMAFTPNPSFMVAITLTTPVFIAMFYRIVGHREEADVVSGMGVVFCAICLALMTAL